MEVEELDRISSLPPNIIQTILTLMPMRDAFRTSILSRNWRYHCRNITNLTFDDFDFKEPTDETLSIKHKHKFFQVIYSILMLHQVPVLKFSLLLTRLESCCEIDQIILHLSRNATLKEFGLWIMSGDEHNLLPDFFKLRQLTVLLLHNCTFQPPVTFKGFNRLVKLSFHDVSITAEAFRQFISNCPLLKDFTLVCDENHLLGSWNFGFFELFECLPLLEHLRMSCYPVKCFAIGVVAHRVPSRRLRVKCLRLAGLSFARETELLCALLLVTSSPNIEIIEMEMDSDPTEAMSQTAMNLIDHADYSYVTLDHLRVIKIKYFNNIPTGMDFVKLVLAKAPMLKEGDIRIHPLVDIHGQLKIVKELIQYPRASTKAEIMIN